MFGLFLRDILGEKGGNFMQFGDWPAWIALSVAIISPVITVYLNNRHQEKMEHIKQKNEWIKEIAVDEK